MAEETESVLVEAVIHHGDLTMGAVAAEAVASGLDVLPVRADDTEVRAMLSLQEIVDMVAQGRQVTLLAVSRGPVDPDRIFTDEQVEADFRARVGPDVVLDDDDVDGGED